MGRHEIAYFCEAIVIMLVIGLIVVFSMPFSDYVSFSSQKMLSNIYGEAATDVVSADSSNYSLEAIDGLITDVGSGG